MEENWQHLIQGKPLANASELTLQRAQAIAEAIARHTDFCLVRCSADKREDVLEILVVDAECHGVPSNNPVGIEFRERLALMVPSKDDEPIEVIALRPEFPRLMHQNARPPGCPPSLCLYFEPYRAVSRTWTPESFLRRIQIWLEKSARGQLHPADQPVEQLFFTAQHELVLPWNVEALLEQVPPPTFEIFQGPQRKDGDTYFLGAGADPRQKSPTISLIQLILPPVVHGRLEADPRTLGDLAEMLAARGVDLLTALTNAIYERVAEEGTPVGQDPKGTIVLLHMPITRTLEGIVEKIARRGYLVEVGALKLGELTSTLFVHDRKYFRELKADFLVTAGQTTAWQALTINPIEVVHGLTRPSARFQSGIADEGPRATLVGAGALGATMLDFWVRSGWGQWTVIDKDHLKPHNLVRHPAEVRHLGMPKEQIALERHNQIMDGASTMEAVHGDACEFVEGKPIQAIMNAQLVVDVSTTLDYPRLMSTRNDVGRHMSVFLTPNGNASAILLEDSDRVNRLRTLEAQYYRAVIAQSWGEEHLAGNLSTYWSGAGCRDISVVMPYSTVMAHAAMLAEQVRSLSMQTGCAIRVWTRDATDGSVTAISVQACEERAVSFDDSTLYIDEALVEKMHTLRETHLPNETGGILLGYHDKNIKAVVVVDAMAAPSDSKSDPASFKRGIEGVAATAQEANRRTAGVVGYIGEWHSHPPGHSANPSSEDFYQLAHLALGMSHDGLPAVSLIVGANRELQAMKCTVR